MPIRAAITKLAFDVVRDKAPDGVDVVPFEDGVELEEIDFLVPPVGPSDLVDQLPSLERLAVVQVLSAGTDRFEDAMPPQATLCSARGARDGPVAEWIAGALLGVSSGLLACARDRTWERYRVQDLESWRILIVGMGSIGHLVAERLAAFGSDVVGVASHAHDGLRGVDELSQLLPTADAVVLLTPLSESTRGLIGTAELAAMRDGAVLVNAARGPVVDTEALVREVGRGRLRAVLDVTDPEPLPEDHPLWTAPGVLAITPHVAGDSPLAGIRAAELAADQLVRWRNGEELRNVVVAASRPAPSVRS
ncbi:MAG: NAD(P)-dependent oxidoreductase [Solirubrobacteraceae bacterium]